MEALHLPTPGGGFGTAGGRPPVLRLGVRPRPGRRSPGTASSSSPAGARLFSATPCLADCAARASEARSPVGRRQSGYPCAAVPGELLEVAGDLGFLQLSSSQPV